MHNGCVYFRSCHVSAVRDWNKARAVRTFSLHSIRDLTLLTRIEEVREQSQARHRLEA